MRIILTVLAVLVGAALPATAYDVLVFGDVHYDTPEVRVPDQDLRPAFQQEYERNLANWRENIPAMLDAAAKRASRNTAFAVQLGDLIQGDCGSETLHGDALEQALEQFTKRFAIPFFPIKGNHDVRGQGGAAAFDRVMLPYLTRTLERAVPLRDAANYAVRHERDLYLFFDSTKPDVEFVRRELAAHPDARYVFFLTHHPVLPFARTKNADQVVFGRPARPVERRALRKLLAERDAIVLCAHFHRTNLLRYRDEDGTITQFTGFSIVSKPDEPFSRKKMTEAPNLLVFPERAEIEAQQKDFAEFLGDYDGRYTEFVDYRPGAGFYRLVPNDSGVLIELYFGTDGQRAATVKLR